MILTFHGGILGVDISRRTLVTKDLRDSRNVVSFKPLFLSDDGAVLFCRVDDLKLYIKKIESQFCELSSECAANYSIRWIEGSFSIETRNGFLSAEKDGSISMKPWSKDWERFRFNFDGFEKDKIGNSDKIAVHFWNKDFNGKYNAGDLLSPYIVGKLLNCNTVFAPLEKGSLVAIGSMINGNTLPQQCSFWGTGVMASSVRYYPNNSFYAVRGPLTRYSLIQAGYDCPDVYGDPALLLPEYYHPVNIRKKYKLGIICHHIHTESLNIDSGVKFINILRSENELEQLVNEINECEKILSSSLHGIIIANAYGIPARWFVVAHQRLGGDPTKKFHDYFSSVRMPMQIPLVLRKGDLVSDSYSKFVDNTVDLKINLSLLKNAFPIGSLDKWRRL